MVVKAQDYNDKDKIMDYSKMKHMRIAIIDDNVLAGMGLQHMLEDLIPSAEIILYHDMKSMRDSEELKLNAHYFVASRIYFSEIDFFQSFIRKTIVLVSGDISIKGVRTLNVCQSEKKLICDIIAMHRVGHGIEKVPADEKAPLLSPREVQVVILLCKGFINKEIGEQLSISLATVMTHRKNIIAKLHARSLADIIIYAVINGYVKLEEL